MAVVGMSRIVEENVPALVVLKRHTPITSDIVPTEHEPYRADAIDDRIRKRFQEPNGASKPTRPYDLLKRVSALHSAKCPSSTYHSILTPVALLIAVMYLATHGAKRSFTPEAGLVVQKAVAAWVRVAWNWLNFAREKNVFKVLIHYHSAKLVR